MKTIAIKENGKKVLSKVCAGARNVAMGATAVWATAQMTALRVQASGFDKVNIGSGDVDAISMMGNIIGIALTITRFVGIGVLVYGMYEFAMSFIQQQPEAKTKGIIFMLVGALLIAAKSIIKVIAPGVIS